MRSPLCDQWGGVAPQHISMEGVARICKKKPKGSLVTLSLPGSDWWLCSYAHIFAEVLYYHCRALPAILLMFHVPNGPLTPSNTTPTSPVSPTENHPCPNPFCHRETSHLEGGRQPPKCPHPKDLQQHTRSHLIPTRQS